MSEPASQLALLGADLADGAEDLRRQPVARVGAQVGLLDLDARELVGPLGDVGQQRGRDVGLQAHGRVRHDDEGVHDLAVDRLRVGAEHRTEAPVAGLQVGGGDLRDRLRLALVALRPGIALAGLLAPGGGEVALLVGQRRRVELDDDRTAVAHDDLAAAVDDLAARRLDAQLAYAVDRRLGEELVARQHLQVPEAKEDDREQREGDAAEDRHAQRELRGDRGPAVVGGLHHHRRFGGPWESGLRPPVV
jgi:hypothetical protein